MHQALASLLCECSCQEVEAEELRERFMDGLKRAAWGKSVCSRGGLAGRHTQRERDCALRMPNVSSISSTQAKPNQVSRALNPLEFE